jgi:hypothetical protein
VGDVLTIERYLAAVRMKNCALCQKIPFDKLPSEEEDALPHQPSLDALEASATSCSLCKLIWWAAGCFMVPLGGMRSETYVEYPSGRVIRTAMVGSSHFSLTGARALEYGVTLFDFSSPKHDLREPVFMDPRSRFLKGTNLRSRLFGNWFKSPFKGPRSRFAKGINVRPWLFGNWYQSPFKDRGFQLIGLGVRLVTGPSIEDAVGNSKEEVNIRGTYLRIRTDDGIELFHYTTWTAMLTSYLDSDMATIVPGRLRTDYQGSPIAFRKVKKWLEDCGKDHDCAKRHSCAQKRHRLPFLLGCLMSMDQKTSLDLWKRMDAGDIIWP